MIATTLPSAPVLAAAMLAALIVIAGLVLVMRRDPRAFPVLAVIALPFRLPIAADGRTVNLLLPLYAVVAAGVLAHLLPRLPVPFRVLGRPGGYNSRQPPMLLDWLLLVSVGLYTLQIAYSSDPGKGAENLLFFYIPFGLLYVLLREAPWTRGLLLTCLAAAVGLAVLFAGVGFIEYYRKALFLNPKVVAANEYDNYFRVNSLFFDPSIYGRFLALVMIAVTTVVLWSREKRTQLWGAAILAWLLAGLVTSFSQSSIAALLLGLAILAAWRWDVRGTVYVSVALAAIAGVFVLVAPSSLHFGLKGSSGSANNATSGRAKLITGGLELFVDRPLGGYGSGSFETEYRRHEGGTAANAVSASHTIPVTIAAEQGIVGLALYVALILAALATLFRGAGRSPPRIAVAACFAALVLHTWVYADFLEDPLTWTLLGLGVAFSVARNGSLKSDDDARRIEAETASPAASHG
ncbi:MAG TPA: O-antigen ligase family protein [Solirubrobacteraceae bacterium]|jgi:O-antigen ligase|nr:O-antigen ligase family protein [Solirubrobacteraceae bacterium]